MVAHQVIADRFEVGEFIAQGGMGAVYCGLDRQAGQPVAIKRLLRERIETNSSLLARFASEGEALRRLDHRNIVKLLATAEHDGEHYLVLEYVGGGSLADRLLTEPRLPIEQTLAIALELADALAHAHHLKIIHRDLKPANVLLVEDGTPRLTDFGVARLAQPVSTTAGVVVGTFAYLPPEVFNGETPDARADIWAFGVMLFEMLTGQRPFEGEQTAALVAAIMYQPTPDLETIRSDVPIALVDLIYRMLEKDRNQRVGSMRQIAAELEALLNNVPNAVRPSRHAIPSDSSDSILIKLPAPTPPHDNLPFQTTPFVGREAELSELAKLLGDSATRLITILGPGGMGKTRLALEAAAAHQSDFADGAYFVSLAPLTDPELIVSTVAESVGFQFYQGGTPKQQLLDFFRAKSMLLVIDNFEHLLSGATLVSDILQAAPHVKIIATSRERLNLHEETLFRIEGMDFPDWETPEDAAEYSAVKLFLQRARRVQPSFALTADHLKYLARICRQVQGMPLGILLAAAWVDNLSLAEISDEIARSLDFLETEVRNVPTRQRSIRAAFDYSWNMLSESERAVFSQSSVFRGGYTREAAQTVTGALLKTLAALVNKSLLRRDPNGRYDIHELLRQYAEAKLSETSGALDMTQDRHCAYFADLMDKQTPRLKGPAEKEALTLIDAEMDNVRAAWDHALGAEQFDAIGRSAEALALFFFVKLGRSVEAASFFKKAIDGLRPYATTQTVRGILGRLLAMFGHFSGQHGQREVARAAFVESDRLLHTDATEYEWAIANLWWAMLNTFYQWHLQLLFGRTFRQFSERQRQSLCIFEARGDSWSIAATQATLITIYNRANNFLAAQASAEQSLAVFQAIGARSWQAFPLRLSALTAIARKQYTLAKNLYHQAIALFQEVGNEYNTGVSFYQLAGLCIRLGDYGEAKTYLERYGEISWQEEDRVGMAWNFQLSGYLAQCQQRYAEAETHYQKAVTIFRQLGSQHSATNQLNGICLVTILQGHFKSAEGCYREAMSMAIQVRHFVYAVESLLHFACLTGKAGYSQRGVEVLTFALHQLQDQCEGDDMDAADFDELHALGERYLAELRAELTPAEFAAAQEQAKSLKLESLVAEILASPPLFPAVG